jgi:hypothetical protein
MLVKQPLLLKLVLTACSLVGGSFLYVLVAIDWDEFDPAIIGPLLGFTGGAVLVIVTLWRTPSGLRRAYRTEPNSWKSAGFTVWAALAPFAAAFMVWVTGLMALAILWAAVTTLGIRGPEGSGWALVVAGWFFGALWITFRAWPIALERDGA